MIRSDAPTDDREGPETPPPTVTAARTSPDRTVFSELDNPNGWIATDFIVSLER